MAEDAFRDFEIHIREPAADGTCRVMLRVAAEDRIAHGTFRSPFSTQEVTRALGWMDQGLFDADYAKQFGARLFTALFGGNLGAFYRSSLRSGGPRLRLRFIIDAAEVSRLPWELAFDPERNVHLALKAPLVRGYSLTEPTRLLTVEPPLRVLVVDSFPVGIPKVQHQLETDGIRAALAKLVRSGRVEVETRSSVSLRTLQRALRDAADPQTPRPFHVLHVIAHGHHDTSTGRTVLLFADDEGRIDEVDPEALVNVVRPFDLRLVVLNACQSLQASSFDVTHGFAPHLLASGIPAVIGMQATVLDEVAIQITNDFYAALADDRSVDAALTDARVLLRGTRHRRKADIGIPVCYLRTASGRLLAFRRTPRGLHGAAAESWLRRSLSPTSLLRLPLRMLTTLATLLGVVIGWQQVFPRPAAMPAMAGDLNIALARFGEEDARGRVIASRAGDPFADEMFEVVSATLDGFDEYRVEIRGPSETGYLLGSNGDEQSARAERLAREIDAHVVIFGSFAIGSDETTVTTSIFVNRQLTDAEELYGPHLLGRLRVPGDIGNPVTRRRVRQELAERSLAQTKALGSLILGLQAYAVGDFGQADHFLQQAVDSSAGLGDDGRKLAHAFLGATALQRNDTAEAAHHLEAALAIDGEYLLARLGVTQLAFREAIAFGRPGETCHPGHTDVAALEEVVEAYRKVRDHPVTTGSTLREKAALLLGQAYLCRSVATGDPDGDDESLARSAFELVIDSHRAGHEGVAYLASEAHAGLAIVHRAKAENLEALSAYQHAIALRPTNDSDRRAAFLNNLARVHLALRQCDEAQRSLELAAASFEEFRSVNQGLSRPAYEQDYGRNVEMTARCFQARDRALPSGGPM
jgi:tetratricopeptide (TPR) repeat protein